MVEKYPKLIQKYALQPQLCYDLMLVWEENCLDLLQRDELVSGQTLILTANFVNPLLHFLRHVGKPRHVGMVFRFFCCFSIAQQLSALNMVVRGPVPFSLFCPLVLVPYWPLISAPSTPNTYFQRANAFGRSR